MPISLDTVNALRPHKLLAAVPVRLKSMDKHQVESDDTPVDYNSPLGKIIRRSTINLDTAAQTMSSSGRSSETVEIQQPIIHRKILSADELYIVDEPEDMSDEVNTIDTGETMSPQNVDVHANSDDEHPFGGQPDAQDRRRQLAYVCCFNKPAEGAEYGVFDLALILAELIEPGFEEEFMTKTFENHLESSR